MSYRDPNQDNDEKIIALVIGLFFISVYVFFSAISDVKKVKNELEKSERQVYFQNE